MAVQIGRRIFIAAIGGAAATLMLAALTARAQQPMPVIGYLSGVTPTIYPSDLIAFRQGLKDNGYVEGKNVAIEFAAAEGHIDRLSAMAAGFVNRHVAVIVAVQGSAPAVAAKAATTTIPIVFASGGDPIKLGLVSSLNHPGANLTGISFLLNALSAKRLQLLHELVPAATMVGFLVNPSNPSLQSELKDMQAAAHAMGLQLVVANADSEQGIATAFATFAEQRIGAFMIAADVYLARQHEQIVALAAQYAIPAIYHLPDFAQAGGLMSYGTSLADAHRIAGVYVGRILKGEKPGDLPVQQSVKVELVINMKTAKTLGLTFPLTLLGRADEVLE